MRRLLTVIGVTTVGVALVAPSALAGEEQDQAAAEKATIKASDVPDDWDSSRGDESQQIQLPECRAIDRATAAADKGPNAKSRNFSDPSDPLGIIQVENAAYVFPSRKKAKKYLDAFTADQAEDCFLAVGEAVAESQVPGADVSVEDLDVDGLGDDGGGVTIVIDGETDDGERVELFADFSAIRVGRGIVVLIAQGSGEQLDLGPELRETLADRLEDAL
jgi:hypothetical protein